jgi:hypothetical protein
MEISGKPHAALFWHSTSIEIGNFVIVKSDKKLVMGRLVEHSIEEQNKEKDI